MVILMMLMMMLMMIKVMVTGYRSLFIKSGLDGLENGLINRLIREG